MWKTQRLHLKKALAAEVVNVRREYSSLLETQARQYIERCAAHPENALDEAHRIVAEGIIKLTYGKLGDKQGEDYTKISARLMDILVDSLQGYVVDLLPALQYLPKWLPGMKFKRDAARLKKEYRELEDKVFEVVRANRLSDDPEVQSSFVFKRMQDIEDNEQQDEAEISIAYSALQIFSEKARAEIDKVIGPGRPPTFNDQPHLPFLEATVKETIRWNPVATFGKLQDAVYNGYFLPKGTTAIVNSWGLARDSQTYPNPSVFDPNRYLNGNEKLNQLDPRKFMFGYGGRICPGKDLAYQNIWIMAASILWAFEIVVEDKGRASLPHEDLFSFGLINHPNPFKCR
ncbi:hypothetical protein FRC01_007085, partial [Tulasnella sp. 417]